MKEFKVTKTMTKAYLGDVLNENLPMADLNLTPDANDKLTERVRYALTHISDKDTTRNDLANLVKELYAALGDKFVQIPVPEKPKTENLVKKPSGDKKKDSKKSDKAPAPRITLMASAFPESIEVGGFKFNIDHTVKTIEDFSDDKEYELAFFWSKRHLRQFAYQWHKSPENPDEFPNDLDTAQLFYVSDKGVVAYCVSDTTEGVYTIYPRDLEEFEGIRYCNGIEYQIYSKDIEKSTETEDADEDVDEEDVDEEDTEDEDTEN